MVQYVFLDLDDTILDFHKAERIALSKTLQDFGIDPCESVLVRYHDINKFHWEALERGEMTREQVLTGRFGMLFRELSVDAAPEAVARDYEHNLSLGHYFLPGAEALLDALRGTYQLYLASNGTASVQHGRLTSAGLYPFFDGIFISQELGYNKPAKEFFDAAFAKIPSFDISEAVMIGDSLTSDIRGGLNAGLKTIWFNPAQKPGREDIVPDYEIASLNQLPALLKTL